jgi:hypothetical protein
MEWRIVLDLADLRLPVLSVDVALDPSPFRQLGREGIQRVTHAGDLAVLHAVGGGKDIQRGTGVSRTRHLHGVDEYRPGHETVGHVQRLLAHPSERGVRKAGFRLRVASAMSEWLPANHVWTRRGTGYVERLGMDHGFGPAPAHAIEVFPDVKFAKMPKAVVIS